VNRIHLLPEQVANQIAAGEVVERPASVVKELVENALDAQAARITVEIQAGGRSLVRVTDDGLGMSRDDALLCLERHATSKLKRAEDLAAISSLGFRGEALPSIASVSRFTLTTRERASDSPEGTQVVVQGGKIVEVKAAGSAPGTCVEVRQLFFNLPARRKFLRSEDTEAAHIHHYLTVAALAFPELAFTFLKDGRTVWQLPAVRLAAGGIGRLEAVRERLRALQGSELKLLPVDHTAELRAFTEAPEEEVEAAGSAVPTATVRVWGLIGAPGVSRATREDQHLFVNRRPVDNRGLNFALLEGYHTVLMKGRYPVAVLFLEIDPAAVDVNIHPAKREVKFHREFEVRRVVAQAVREALLAFHQPPELGKSEVRSPQSAVPEAIQPSLPSLPAAPAPEPSASQQPALPMGFSRPPAVRPAEIAVHGTPSQLPTQIPAPASASRHPASGIQHPASAPANPQSAIPNPQSPIPLLRVPLRMVGVIGRLYVVLESDRGLVLVDQHAAHERILFEQMLQRLEQNALAPSQRLLLAETLELAPRDALFLREQLAALTRLGVGLSEFGERTFLLDALPPFVKVSDARQFALDLVDELKAAGEEVNTLRLGEHVVAKTVCRHAVKANDPLQGAELDTLIEDLRRCAMPYTCPHGRPTILEMNWRELEKKFGRTQ
jgi:DNA mismatch repair protein MutL